MTLLNNGEFVNASNGYHRTKFNSVSISESYQE